MASAPWLTRAVDIVVPSCPSTNVTVYEFVDHCAYSVTVPPSSAVRFFTSCPFEYELPVPSALAFHSVHFALGDEKPFGESVFVSPYRIDISGVDPVASALFPSNRIRYKIGVHCAYSVTEPFDSDERLDTDAPSAYSVPDTASDRRHPENM